MRVFLCRIVGIASLATAMFAGSIAAADPLTDPVAPEGTVTSAIESDLAAEDQAPAATVRIADAEDADEAEADGFVQEVSELSELELEAAAPVCDDKKMADLKKAVAGSHKPMFYDNKFDYLCDPCYCDWHLGDRMKRLGIGDHAIVDIGGQYRTRFHHEQNMRNDPLFVPNALGLTGVDDTFLLHRTRFYVNAEIGNRIRFYGEALDADSNYETHIPRTIEVNRTDIQNMFLDAVLLDDCRGKLTARIGRQELLYGNQRIASPLDWANTRRTFEGGKLMWQGESWDIDGFYTHPLRRTHANATRLDPPLLDIDFWGVHSTYKDLGKDKLELYWLGLDNYITTARYNTLGGRYYAERDAWLYEFEGGYQFGRNFNGSDHSAGAYTFGLGRKMDNVCWKPVLWGYYDWASGSDTVDTGYDHMFPLVHKYLGYMDLYGRRNIESANVLLTAKPHDKLSLLVWYYYFWLQNGNDVPYNVDMTRFARLPGGSAGSRDLGHEIDVTLTYALTARMEVLFGYSHFFAGEFYKTTPGVPYRNDADFFYTHFQVNF